MTDSSWLLVCLVFIVIPSCFSNCNFYIQTKWFFIRPHACCILYMGKYCCGKIWDFGGICRCFTHQLLPFILSCSYTSNSFVHILSSNCFGLAHSPMFYPTKIFPRTVYIPKLLGLNKSENMLPMCTHG